MAVAPFALRTSALKPGDIAARLGVEPSTVYRWIRSGALPAIEVGGAKYVLIPAYERFIERRTKGVSIDEQAERYIGSGVEVEGEVDLLDGLDLPIARPSGRPVAPLALAVEALRGQLKQQLDAYEARFDVPSERVHRSFVVDRQPHIEGVPDDVISQWASFYAAYLDLSLVQVR